MYYYIATGYNANATSNACLLRTSSNQMLAVLHYDTLRFYNIQDKELIYDFSYSRKQNFALMLKVPFDDYDCLLLMAKDCSYYLVKVEDGEAITVFNGSLKKDFPKRGDNRFLGVHCRNKRYIALCLYNSIIDIMALTPTNIDGINSLIILIEHEHVIDMIDLSSSEKTSLGLLVRSVNGYNFCIYDITSSSETYEEVKADKVHRLSNKEQYKVIALNLNTFFTFSTETINLYEINGKLITNINLPEATIILCYTFIDSNTLLMATSKKKLYKVTVNSNRMKIDILGNIPYSSGIAHIKDNLIYVCSINNDNVLLKMDDCKVLELYENLACISDFIVQRGQMVACCNHLEYSEICVLKKGFALKKITSIPMQMVIDIWSIKNYLIIGLINEIRVFHLDSFTLSETINLPFLYTSRTLLMTQIKGNILQITTTSIRLYTPTFTLLQSEDLPIVHTIVDTSKNLLAICGKENQIHVYEVAEDLKLITTLNIAYEVSAMEFTDKDLVVATWESTLEVYDIKTDKKVIVKIEDKQIRSMVYKKGLLLCGTSDGYLIVYEGLEFQCCSVMGIKEVKLKRFGDEDTVALSDTATLITVNKGKINYLPFIESEKTVQAIEKLDSEIVLATSEELSVNVLCNKPLNCRYRIEQQYKFQARKIVCESFTNHLIILGDEDSYSKLFVFSGTTYKCVDTYSFPLGQMACSIMITNRLINDASENIILVGTVVDADSMKGELLTFVLRNDKLKILYKDNVQGYILALGQYKDYILCSVNAGILMYKVQSVLFSQKIEEFYLKRVHYVECVRCTLITFIQIYENILIAGDITSFLGVFVIKESKLQELSMHPKPYWANCGLFIGYNQCLVAVKNELCAVELDFKGRNVQILDSIKIDQDITQIQRGTFIDKKLKNVFELKTEIDKQLKAKGAGQLFVPGNELVYSTNFGAIGVIIGITEEAFIQLNKLQSLLIDQPMQRKGKKTFINGEVVQKFLKLPIDRAKEIYDKIESPKLTLQELFILLGQLILFH